MLKLYASLKVYDFIKEYKFKLKMGINDYYNNQTYPLLDVETTYTIRLVNKKIFLYAGGNLFYERTFGQFYREHAEVLRQRKNSVIDRLHSTVSVSDIA